ncbi:hypothetical protein [Streptomyces sp. NPDC050738]|uniref:hypothetical protein n=1 Tax=Streptomyces sp. NPDC050738 TaxID=3154744 RepID=UPI003420F21C
MNTALTRAPAPAAGSQPSLTPPAPRSPHRTWNTLATLAPALLIAFACYRQRWVGDDGLIYTRVVRQILAGNGPVFNVGERAESSTGTLWQWLIAAGSLYPGTDPARVATALGVFCTGAGFLLALDGARRFHPARSLLVPAGVLVLLPVQAVWDYGTSGLESGLVFGWLGLSWWLLVRTATAPVAARTHLATCAVLGLGPLVRPELGAVSAVFLATAWFLGRPGWRATTARLAAAVALPLAYEIFRAGYYGILVPLPGVTKEASTSLWGRGLLYLGNFVEPYRLWLPLLLVAGLTVEVVRRSTHGRRDTAIVAAPLVAGLLCTLYAVKVGGDFMHGRTLLPALFLLLLPVMLVPLTRVSGAVVAALGVWAAACLLFWRPPHLDGGASAILDEHAGYIAATGSEHPVSQSVHAARNLRFTHRLDSVRQSGSRSVVIEMSYDKRYAILPLTARIPAPLAGAEARLGHSGTVIPLDGRAIDTLGLAYPLGAHIESRVFTKAGHDKPLPREWIIADYTDPGTPTPPGIQPRRVAAARHALTCGPLAELQASVREPMTLRRFTRNLAGAWDRTAFRFPSDPVEAERRLCGRG